MVGSLNQDITVRVPHHPRPGETVLGFGHAMAPGGKGANQAVAAARMGQAVAMVGAVGGDSYGDQLRTGLEAEGIDVSHVKRKTGVTTGLALIALDEEGENSIVVSPGANSTVSAEDVKAAGSLLASADVTLLQLEIPVAAVAAAAERAGGIVILNPAPAIPLPASLLAKVDVLVPNRTELGMLAERDSPFTPQEVLAAALELRGPQAIVVTLGADGAALIQGEGVEVLPAPMVQPVDTVGAGDAFCGALADGLARGMPLTEAVRRGIHAGAIAATREGAQPSLPLREEVEKSLKEESL